MEKIQEFMSSPKKTAVLGLIGTIIMLISPITMLKNSFLGLKNTILTYLLHIYLLVLLIYFSIVLLRIFKGKGNIKFANYILIITLAVAIIFNSIRGLISDVILLLIFELYLINILLKKKTFINNKIALITLIICIVSLILTYIVNLVEKDIIYSSIFDCIGYICIMPYFYEYYILLNKGGK